MTYTEEFKVFKEYLDNSKKFIKLKDAEFKLVPKI
jgi:hypothetical protein